METPLSRLMAKALAGKLPPLPDPDDDGTRQYGEKTLAMRKEQEATYGQIFGSCRPQAPRA